MNPNINKIEIASTLTNIKAVFNWFEETLFNKIIDKEKLNGISLVIQEALVNAIVHGNNEDENKKVFISSELENNSIILEFKDEGKGIPIDNQLKDSSNIQSDDLLKDSGRGIILMKHFCTEVNFNKNCLQLVIEL